MNKRPSVVFVCGFTGAGKTVFARRIQLLLGTRIINKDKTLDAIVNSMNTELGNPAEDRHSKDYLKLVRPFEYQVLLRTVEKALERNQSIILDAPLIVEVSTKGWIEQARKTLDEKGFDAIFVWMESPLDENRKRLAERESSEDQWKLDHWDEYSKTIEGFAIPREKFDFIVNATGQKKEISEIVARID